MPTPRGTMYGSLGSTSSTRERANERQARGCSWSRMDSYSTFQPAWLKIDAAPYGSSVASRGASIRDSKTQAVARLLTLPQNVGSRRATRRTDLDQIARPARAAPHKTISRHSGSHPPPGVRHPVVGLNSERLCRGIQHVPAVRPLPEDWPS